MNGTALRERRRKALVSQAELGVALGRSQVWIGRLERGLIRGDEATYARVWAEINRIASRKEVIAKAQIEAAERVSRDFENRKKSADAGQ
jgi:predicted transcriptional regulator